MSSEFDEILQKVTRLLESEQRVSYRSLKRRFSLNDDDVEDLKAELIDAKRIAEDEAGRVLVFKDSASRGPRQPAERRQLTVMFCDLVGSVGLAEQLGPENLREVIQAYQQMCADCIAPYEGYIAQYLGDGVLIYFGYPLAHEDDARRSLLAGLSILRGIKQLNRAVPGDPGVELQVRIGVHTGMVVVGEIGPSGNTQLALGEAPNVAARLQALARPDTLVISEATEALVRGRFDLDDLGPQSLKGMSTSVTAYQVLAPARALKRPIQASLTPLIGRQQELLTLRGAWQEAQRGRGKAVLIVGEAGIGKSRLVRTVQSELWDSEALCIEARCSPYHQNSAFYPVTDWIAREMGFTDSDSDVERARKLRHGLKDWIPEGAKGSEETLAAFAFMAGLPITDPHASSIGTPQGQKQRSIEAVVDFVGEVCVRRPLLLVVEDLHWLDPSTHELLALLLSKATAHRVLVLLTQRPDSRFVASEPSLLQQINLERLPRAEVETMLREIFKDKALSSEVAAELVTNTDGIPLFIEECTRMVRETGWFDEAGPVSGSLTTSRLGIPASLRDLLVARFDRLGDARSVLQEGAVLGRSFPLELLAEVSSTGQAELELRLARLVDSGLLIADETADAQWYTFKHALIQEAAYESLLTKTRRALHRQTAEALVERLPHRVEQQPELLARHFAEAGLGSQAIPYWQKAAQRALERSANAEAVGHLEAALTLLDQLPEAERPGMELLLRISSGMPLIATKGYAAPEVEQTFARARTLCEGMARSAQIFPALWGLWAFYVVRSDFANAKQLGTELSELANASDDVELKLEVQPVLGHNYFWTGDIATAKKYFEEGVRLYDGEKHVGHAVAYGQDPAVVSHSYLAWIHWLLGDAPQGQHHCEQAIAVAEKRGHLHSLGYAIAFACVYYCLIRDPKRALEMADRAIELSIEHGFPIWLADGEMIRGWARAQLGSPQEGLEQLATGMGRWQAIGARLWRTGQLAILAEVSALAGDLNAGLAAVAEGLAMAEETGEAYALPELKRMQGLILDKQGADPSKVEACFIEARELARQSGAVAWRLRASHALAQHWLRLGRSEEAKTTLQEATSDLTAQTGGREFESVQETLRSLSRP